MTGSVARAPRVRAGAASRAWVRGVVAVLLVALAVPVLVSVFTPPARADDAPDDYSLYQLASNASSYFSNENSPENGQADADERMTGEWHEVTKWPGKAGSLLGYADPKFSWSLKWLFSEASGSSQTLGYDTFQAKDGDGRDLDIYKGLMDYAHFGAANNDLGFDSMSSGIGGGMLHAIGGSIIWFAYALAMGVSWIFWLVIQILKLLNPFVWFHQGVASVSPAYAEFADGMADGGRAPGTGLSGLSNFIAQWYGPLVELSWHALVPLFIGFLLIGLVFFKKMDRGSAIKKLIVRVVFIGVGLPLIGSLYTSVLNQFDDSMLGQQAGPTRVVLSTYVDFNQWMTRNRLAVPAEASISWDAREGHALPESVLSARTSALAINVQAHGGRKGAFRGISVGAKASNAEDAWKTASITADDGDQDANAVFTTMGMLGRYITSQSVSASDFESGIKGTITQIPDEQVNPNTKRKWFTKDGDYGESDGFGEGGDPVAPVEHPLISTGAGTGGVGLDSSASGTAHKTFSSRAGTKVDCGYAVTDAGGAPVTCNLSPLAAYNYLNTGFGSDSLTMYSSNKATSGFTRENHDSVSQVGTGPASFMYWCNAVVLLFSIVVVGLFYGVGMLVTSTKRTFGVIAAVPFATLGALAGISKVIIYSTALILEIFTTLFLYQFISEFLVSLPQIIEGPISNLVTGNQINGVASVFANPVLGSTAVIVMTVLSTVMIIGVTFALLRVRRSVLQALDEAVTKLVDKFLDTTTPPKTGGGGLLPAVAGGLGAGAGMAATSGLMNRFGGAKPKPGGGTGGGAGGRTGGSPTAGSTNAGGTNGPVRLSARSPQAQVLPGAGGPGGGGPGGGGPAGAGRGGGPDGPDDLGGFAVGPGPGDSGGPRGLGDGGQDGALAIGSSGAEGPAKALPAGTPESPGGPGSRMLTNGGKTGRSHQDRSVAHRVDEQGGLSKRGRPQSSQSGGGPGVMPGGDTPDTDLGGTNASRPAAPQGSGSGRKSHSDKHSAAIPSKDGNNAATGSEFRSPVEDMVPGGGAGGGQSRPPRPVPARPDQLPSRQEAIQSFGGEDKVAARARAKGLSQAQFEQRYLGPFRKDGGGGQSSQPVRRRQPRPTRPSQGPVATGESKEQKR
ncbi:hypothetical protein [Actinomadura syzygii]|uniref:Uncharacterized protein n=1 Tax=Actinomadura syzygii TaxID=1427538 RepID=A0A5D0TQN8_9ACTN|nr:hypothetical protein [Actinomadura syzygii]TYC08621.1 hypothetical protein FXF65_37655 [Actinomadura syzygii]